MQYFAPYKSDGISLNTLRSNEALLHNVSPLTWGLREVLQYAEVLLNKDDVDAKADALIDFIRERVVDREFSDPLLGNKHYLVRSFADLEAWFRDVLSAHGGEERRRLAHAPRRDDPEGAEPAVEHLDPLRRPGDRRRRRRATCRSGAFRTARCM